MTMPFLITYVIFVLFGSFVAFLFFAFVIASAVRVTKRAQSWHSRSTPG